MFENINCQHFDTEREGQIEFFKQFHIDYLSNPVLVDNTDGIWKGNILEFKLNIEDPNSVLFQSIKYLSRLRLKGESIPANIVLISLNNGSVYIYPTEDYFDNIHTIYYGAASKQNDGFIAKNKKITLNYLETSGAIRLKEILNSENFIPIRIDEDSVVGWAERYYRENPKASKGDFIGDNEGKIKIKGEIRDPRHFKGLILPYEGKTNEKFKYLMDKLNDRLQKKDLGAYYTPRLYCEKAAELLRLAIKNVPQGNDYVIIDRCAGTGNLEDVLNREELSHCILSTYEYYEYKVLNERLGDKVRFIIPPTEQLVQYEMGKVKNADALSEDFIFNNAIRKYINDPNCTIILYENPPYQDSSSKSFIDENNQRAKSSRKDSFVKNEFVKEIYKLDEKQGAAREIANLFIWSAFKYYLRQPTDAYIVFSPVKYFKSIGLVKKKFIKGYAFNRKHFHASESVISCILWQNINEQKDNWTLETFDIERDEDKSEKLCKLRNIIIRRVKSKVSEYNDKRLIDDAVPFNLYCKADGTQLMGWNPSGSKKSINSKDIIAYLVTIGFSLDSSHRCLTRLPYYTGIKESFGYYLRKDVVLQKLPIFCAKLYRENKWWKKDIYYTSADKKYEYLNDIDFLKSCLIYTCLSESNKCFSILGTDGNIYLNELCFDVDTYASGILVKFNLNKNDNILLSLNDDILKFIKTCEEYNKNFKYGISQINTEINIFWRDERGTKIYKYPELNGNLLALKRLLFDYYDNNIAPKLFEYELLK